jgi:hypothetical protein
MRLALHRCHYPFAVDEAAYIGTACFLDEFLQRKIGMRVF